MTDPNRRRSAARRMFLGLVVALALAACGGVPGTPGPSVDSSAPPDGSVPLDPPAPFACHGLGEADCLAVLEAALGALAAGDPPVVYAEVGPFWCPANPGCERSLVARPAGRVFLELAGADPVELGVERAADGSLALERAETFTVLAEPSSNATGIAGPIELDLGHCGLLSGIDVDGSWWDPVGFVDSDHGDAINAAHGIFAFQGPNQATYTSDGGLVVALVRRAGAKHLPLCM